MMPPWNFKNAIEFYKPGSDIYMTGITIFFPSETQ